MFCFTNQTKDDGKWANIKRVGIKLPRTCKKRGIPLLCVFDIP